MKTQNLLLLVITIFFTISCNKNDKEDGIHIETYFGRFDYGNNNVKTQFLDITEKIDNSVIINSDTLEMTSDSIKGKLKLPFSANGLDLKGKWTGQIFKENFKIEGYFTETGYNHGGSYTYSGTFSVTLE